MDDTIDTSVLTITKRFTFEAHHKLPWHDGKCARDHGHSYVMELSMTAPVTPDDGAPNSGMVMDFSELSAELKPVIDRYLDHHSINDILPNPTAERLVQWLVEHLSSALPDISRVRVYETETAWVEWSR